MYNIFTLRLNYTKISLNILNVNQIGVANLQNNILNATNDVTLW